MLRRRTAVIAVSGLFTAALFLALVTHSTGIVRNDPERKLWIPGELTMPLELKVAYNEERDLLPLPLAGTTSARLHGPFALLRRPLGAQAALPHRVRPGRDLRRPADHDGR
jgi:hypothetical protein